MAKLLKNYYKNTDIAFESISIAQEGKIEQIKTFIQRAITTKKSMEKAIISLKGSKVVDVYEQEDKGKFSGLKLLDIDKVDSKSILKYLELIKSEKNKAIDISNKVFSEATKAVKILEENKDTDSAYSAIFSIENKLDDYYEEFSFELKKHKKTISSRNKIFIISAEQNYFDKILIIFTELLDTTYLKELSDKETKLWGYFDGSEDYGNDSFEKVFETTLELLVSVSNFMEEMIEFEDKFLFSLLRYLQCSIK